MHAFFPNTKKNQQIMNQFPWGLRMTKYEEQLGADLIEHGLAGHNIAKYSIEKKLNVKSVFLDIFLSYFRF
jgi:hypothetical protein